MGTIEGIRVFMQERMCVIKCLQNVLMAANGPHQTMDLSSAPIQSPPHSPSSPYSHLSSSTSTSSSSTSASVVSVFDFTTSVIRGMDLMDDRHEHTNETSLLGLSLSKLVHLVPQSEV